MNLEEPILIYQVVVLVRDVAMSIKTGNTVIPGLFCNNEINVFIFLVECPRYPHIITLSYMEFLHRVVRGYCIKST